MHEKPDTYLVKSREYIIRELNLGDGGMSHHGKAYTEPENTLFCEWSVEDAFTTELFC